MRLAGIFVGGAGFLSGNWGEQVQNVLEENYPNCRIACNSDVMNIIACGSNSRSCIAVVCGTGSVIYAVEEHKFHRLGGGGYLLDRKGSGYDIGTDALRTALQERDGTGPASRITTLVEERLGGPVWDNINEIYKRGTPYIAAFAPVVFDAYAQGDACAAKILRENVGYLAHLIKSAARQYTCGKTVVVSGSIFRTNPVFLQMLKEQLPDTLEVEVPSYPPVYGACVLACELCGIETTDFSGVFLAQYETYLK